MVPVGAWRLRYVMARNNEGMTSFTLKKPFVLLGQTASSHARLIRTAPGSASLDGPAGAHALTSISAGTSPAVQEKCAQARATASAIAASSA